MHASYSKSESSGQGLLQCAGDQRNGLILPTEIFVCVERNGKKKIHFVLFLLGLEKGGGSTGGN